MESLLGHAGLDPELKERELERDLPGLKGKLLPNTLPAFHPIPLHMDLHYVGIWSLSRDAMFCGGRTIL